MVIRTPDDPDQAFEETGTSEEVSQPVCEGDMLQRRGVVLAEKDGIALSSSIAGIA